MASSVALLADCQRLADEYAAANRRHRSASSLESRRRSRDKSWGLSALQVRVAECLCCLSGGKTECVAAYVHRVWGKAVPENLGQHGTAVRVAEDIALASAYDSVDDLQDLANTACAQPLRTAARFWQSWAPYDYVASSNQVMDVTVPSATVFDENVLQDRIAASLAGVEQPPLSGSSGRRMWAHRWRRRMGVIIGTNRARQYVPVAELQEKARAVCLIFLFPRSMFVPKARSQNGHQKRAHVWDAWLWELVQGEQRCAPIWDALFEIYRAARRAGTSPGSISCAITWLRARHFCA